MRAKLLWAKPDLEPELLENLVTDIVKDNITNVQQLKLLNAQDLTSRYNVPFFTALELAQKFSEIGRNKIHCMSRIVNNYNFSLKTNRKEIASNMIYNIFKTSIKK